ncbi:MAG: 50S ribosomal protein L31 [Nitrosarchaeum sp.]|nr:50S ribosomal protein L31 [Nitrosarchaeum sp.]PHY08609.1 MAG: 50S ribosomal protein L31 [Nitrosarchaeum sp.]
MSQELERVYTINLGKVLLSANTHRAPRAINMIREFARHHMKTEEIKIDEDLAHQIWARGVRSPPRKIRVRMSKTDQGYVLVSPYTDEKVDTTNDKNSKKDSKNSKKDSKKDSKNSKKDAKKDPVKDSAADIPAPEVKVDTPVESIAPEKTILKEVAPKKDTPKKDTPKKDTPVKKSPSKPAAKK